MGKNWTVSSIYTKEIRREAQQWLSTETCKLWWRLSASGAWILSNMDWPCKSLDLNIIEAVWLNWDWEHNIQRIALEWPLRLPQEMARNFRLNWILKAVIPNFKFLRIVQTLYKVFPCMFLDVTVHCYSHLPSYIRKWGAAQDFCAVLYAWHSLHAKKKCHSHRLQIRQNSQLPGHPVEVLQK